MCPATKGEWKATQIWTAAGAAIPAAPENLLPERNALGQLTGCMLTPAELLAQVDIRREAAAEEITRKADRLAEDIRAGLAGPGASGELAELRELAKAARDPGRLARLDASDVRRGRGRFRPLATHSPARAFASAITESPADYCRCSGCGVRAALYLEAARCLCGGTYRRAWEAPEISERFAMAAARAEGVELAEQTGSAVRYAAVRDELGIWLTNEAVPDVGYEPVLRAEETLRPSKLPGPGEVVAAKSEMQAAIARRVEATLEAVAAHDARRRGADRQAGRKAKRGRAGKGRRRG